MISFLTLVALLSAPSFASAVQYFIYPGTDLSKIDWSIGKTGDELVILPGTYTTPLMITGITFAITVRPQDINNPPILTSGVNIYNSNLVTVQDLILKREVNIRNSTKIVIQRNTVEVVGYNPAPGGSFQWAAIIVTHGSSDIFIGSNIVKNAFVGISIGGSPTTELPNGVGIRVFNNTISNIYNHGIAVGNILLTTVMQAKPVYLSSNRIFDNGGHGIEFMARYGIIESNIVRNNGFRYPGTSGIHIFSHGKGLDEQCNDNLVQYNFVSEQKDRSSVNDSTDGNGIQVDTFCKRNTIQFNVVWLNDGAGINIFAASNNVVKSNTVYNNFMHIQRSPWAGRGEIMVTAAETPCPSNPSQVCVWVPKPDGSSWEAVPFPVGAGSGNKVFNNVLYKTRPENPGLLIGWSILNPVWGNRVNSKFGPNLYYGTAPANSLYWNAGCPGFNTFNATSPCWRSTEATIDSTTTTTGNAILPFTFKAPDTPLKPYHGLSLTSIPVKRGEAWTTAYPWDMNGSTGTSCAIYFGAYYYPSNRMGSD